MAMTLQRSYADDMALMEWLNDHIWPFEARQTDDDIRVGALLGAALMAVLSLFSNYYVVYPIYTNIMSMDAILGMYRAINPGIENLWQALLVFNVPFTFCKGLISAAVTLAVYKKLEPVINGRAL